MSSASSCRRATLERPGGGSGFEKEFSSRRHHHPCSNLYLIYGEPSEKRALVVTGNFAMLEV